MENKRLPISLKSSTEALADRLICYPFAFSNRNKVRCQMLINFFQVRASLEVEAVVMAEKIGNDVVYSAEAEWLVGLWA